MRQPDPRARALPSREDIALLEPFERIGLDRIQVVASAPAAAEALARLRDVPVLGFDTESRPTFVRGEVSEGPHVVQFATAGQAWVFQLQQAACVDAVGELLASSQVAKAGFGLAGDRTQIIAKFGVAPVAVLDLEDHFRALGFRKSVGVKTAVAMLFNRRLLKSKKVATTNWSQARLTESQVLYAANDAWAAIRVFEALELGAR
jgi:ribonuclease D